MDDGDYVLMMPPSVSPNSSELQDLTVAARSDDDVPVVDGVGAASVVNKRAPPQGFWGARGKRAGKRGPPQGFWGSRGKRNVAIRGPFTFGTDFDV